MTEGRCLVYFASDDARSEEMKLMKQNKTKRVPKGHDDVTFTQCDRPIPQ